MYRQLILIDAGVGVGAVFSVPVVVAAAASSTVAVCGAVAAGAAVVLPVIVGDKVYRQQ